MRAQKLEPRCYTTLFFFEDLLFTVSMLTSLKKGWNYDTVDLALIL